MRIPAIRILLSTLALGSLAIPANGAEILWSQYCQHLGKMKLDTDPTAATDFDTLLPPDPISEQSNSNFAKSNLHVWAYEEYDAVDRTPAERANVLVDLGIRKAGYKQDLGHPPKSTYQPPLRIKSEQLNFLSTTTRM